MKYLYDKYGNRSSGRPQSTVEPGPVMRSPIRADDGGDSEKQGYESNGIGDSGKPTVDASKRPRQQGNDGKVETQFNVANENATGTALEQPVWPILY